MPFRFVRRVLAAVAITVVVAVGLLLWRLSAGPIEFDFLADRIASALSHPERGFLVRFDGIRLEADEGLALTARNVRVVAPNGEVLARSPRATLGLSRSALLRGMLAPSSVDLVGVRVRLHRRLDGSVRFTLADLEDEAKAAEPGDAEFDLSDFLRRPDPSKPTGYLTRLRVSDGTVVLFDERSGSVWRAPESNFSIARDETQITAGLGTTIDAPRGEQRLDASGGLDLASGEAWLDLRIGGLRLARLAPLVPALDRTSALDMAFDATASMRFAADGSIRQGRFQASGRDGALAMDDESAAVDIPSIKLGGAVQAGGDAINLEEVSVAIGDSVVSARGNFDFGADAVRIDASVSGLNPAAIAPVIPSLPQLGQLSVPLEGDIAVRLSEDGDLDHLAFVLEGEGGTLTITEPVPVSRLSVSGGVTGASGEVRIDNLVLDLDGPVITASGRGAPADEGFEIQGEAVAVDTPVDSLEALWPPDVVPGGRRWITRNLSGGRVGEARIELSTVLGSAAPGSEDDVSGSLSFAGVTTRYWEPLPPFEDVAGRATFSGRTFDVDLDRGRLGNIVLRQGKVALTGLGLEPGNELADVTVTFAGPMSEIMTVLDYPPLGYAKWLKLDPAQIGGEAVVRLSVELPLLEDLDLDDVKIAAESDLRDIAVPEIVLGENLEDADLTLAVDKARLQLTGEGRLAGMPGRLDVTHVFEGDSPGSRVQIQGVLTDEVRRALGPEIVSHVEGPVPMELTLVEGAGGEKTVDVELDLQEAALSLPMAEWSKAASVPGVARARLRLDGERLVRVESFEVNAGTGYAKGRGSLTADGSRLERVDIDRLRLGERTDLAAHADFGTDGGTTVHLTGATLDVSPFLNGLDEAPTETALADVTLVARLGQVWIGARHPLLSVDGHVRLTDGIPRSGEARGEVGEGNGLHLTLAEAEGERRLRVALDDAGKALRTLGWVDSLSGGNLRVLASRPIQPRDAAWRGAIETDAFRLSGAPLAARILAAASFTGLADLSSRDEGISFEKLEAPFALGEGLLELDPGRAYGDALGITFFGSVDLDTDNVDVAGTIVPAYTVNRVLGAIPILGDLLTGEEGGGLFAATYRARGAIDEPEVTVNPLAALAPGFLRTLFGEIVGGAPPGRQTAPDPAATEQFPGNLN